MRAALIEGDESILGETQQDAGIVLGGIPEQLVTADRNLPEVCYSDGFIVFTAKSLDEFASGRRERSKEESE
jgi:hypothetical protein